ncbi:MAG TPA: hypothetical protein VK797_19865 [Tepidisphaeraceae bacterium]|nr:hypothetical protein [Tepidisphaeraceae bacterium]
MIISTHCAWLPGDKRGWRSRDHRIHSSGDYKNPPPRDEHDGLLRYNKARSAKSVIIPQNCRATVGNAIVGCLLDQKYRVLVASVSGMHAHFLVELPGLLPKVRRIVGVCKAKSSGAIRKAIPGRVWAERGKYLWVKDRPHLLEAYRYIRDKQGPKAWVWTFRPDDLTMRV